MTTTTTSTTIAHRDGTITYWSVYAQEWRRRAWAVPDRELAAMSPRDRERVIAALGRRSAEDD